jgi:hypothetical protein
MFTRPAGTFKGTREINPQVSSHAAARVDAFHAAVSKSLLTPTTRC